MTNQNTATQLMDIAARIREMREILGHSDQKMAEMTEVSLDTYRSYVAIKYVSVRGTLPRRTSFSRSYASCWQRRLKTSLRIARLLPFAAVPA